MFEEKKKITHTVTGYYMGRHVSVPGHASLAEAYAYAWRKNWSEIRTIRG